VLAAEAQRWEFVAQITELERRGLQPLRELARVGPMPLGAAL